MLHHHHHPVTAATTIVCHRAVFVRLVFVVLFLFVISQLSSL
jgi:hypothetical protein